MKIENRTSKAVKAAPASATRSAPKKAETRTAAAKFSKDEMSFGIGKALKLPPQIKKGSLSEKIKDLVGTGGVKDLGELFTRLHDLRVARGLRTAINGQLEGVKLSRPLPPSEAPHRGKDGRMYAPNGDPLIEVKLSSKELGVGTASSRTAYVNPKTNEYYVVDSSHGCFGPPRSRAYGPMALPKGSHFEDSSFSPWELRALERAANGSFPNFPHLPQLPQPLPRPMPQWPVPQHPSRPLLPLPLNPVPQNPLRPLPFPLPATPIQLDPHRAALADKEDKRRG